jgi:hypothetical protein
MVSEQRTASFFLRVGLAIVFLYAGIASLLTPTDWIGFIPAWVRSMVPAEMFLMLFSAFEILLALWLLSGKRAFWSAIVSCITIFSITVGNLGALDIVFRDVTIFAMGVALAALHGKER